MPFNIMVLSTSIQICIVYKAMHTFSYFTPKGVLYTNNVNKIQNNYIKVLETEY